MYMRELSEYDARGRVEKFSAIISLIVLCLSIFLIGLSSYGLFDVDETLYASSAMEMIDSGDYIIPTFNGEPRLNKPILFYWLESGARALLGKSPGAFRAVSAATAFGLVMLVGFLCYRESRVESGFLAGAMLATSPLFSHLGRVVMIDMLFSALIFSASITLYLGIFDSKNINRILVRTGFLLMALALLAKGPMGVLLPLLAITIFSWVNGRIKRMLLGLADPRAIIIFILVALSWYGAIIIQKGGGFFYEYFIRERFQQLFTINTSHRGPIYYYVPIVLVGLFPWSVFLPQAVFDLLKERGFSLKAVGENISLDMFLLMFSTMIFCFYSLSSAKLPPYILSIFPALAMIVSFYLEKILVYRKTSDLGFSVGTYIFAFAGVAISLFLFFPRDYFPIISEAGLDKITYVPGIILTAGASIAVIINVFRDRIRRPRTKIFASLLITQMFFLWFAFFGVLPRVYQYRQMDLQNISQKIDQKASDSSSVIFYRRLKPSVVMHTGRRIERAISYEEMIALRKGKKDIFLIIRGNRNKVADLASLGKVRNIYRGNLYSLYRYTVE